MAIVGTGSPETVDFAAQRGWAYSQVFTPKTQQIKAFNTLRELTAKYGHEMSPSKCLFNAIIYVAESQELAEKEAVEHIKFYFQDALRTTPRFLAPPGYISIDQFRQRASVPNVHGDFNWDNLTQQWRVAVGTADHVAESINTWCEEAQSARVILHHHIGDMPHWKVVKNMTLFAEEVMPKLRPAAAHGRRRIPGRRSGGEGLMPTFSKIFKTEEIVVNGVKVAMLTAGKGRAARLPPRRRHLPWLRLRGAVGRQVQGNHSLPSGLR